MMNKHIYDAENCSREIKFKWTGYSLQKFPNKRPVGLENKPKVEPRKKKAELAIPSASSSANQPAMEEPTLVLLQQLLLP